MPSQRAAVAREKAVFAGRSWSGARRVRTADLLLAKPRRGAVTRPLNGGDPVR